MSEVRTARLQQSWLWKQGKTGVWVRRYYVLVRREQIDEMINAATDILHELCTFDSPSDHSECLSSLELEAAVEFEHGPDAGLPANLRILAEAAREQERQRGIKSKGSVGFGDTKRTLFSGLAEMFPIKFGTDEISDYTLQLTFPHKIVRLRAETKTIFETWKRLLLGIIPNTKAQVPYEGWLWRRIGTSFEQRYCIIFEGVLFFFVDRETCEKFKCISSRGNDAVFVAAPLSEASIALEHCESEGHATLEGHPNVITLDVEESALHMQVSAVDQAQMTSWLHAVRNGRQWWEGVADDHPSRKLFGGLGGEEEGPMIAQNSNPLADLYGDDEDAKAAAAAAAEAARILKERREAERKARKEAKAKRKAEREAAKKAKLLQRSDSPQRSNSNGSKGSGRSGGSKKSGKSGKSGKSAGSKKSGKSGKSGMSGTSSNAGKTATGSVGGGSMSMAGQSLLKRAAMAATAANSRTESPAAAAPKTVASPTAISRRPTADSMQLSSNPMFSPTPK